MSHVLDFCFICIYSFNDKKFCIKVLKSENHCSDFSILKKYIYFYLQVKDIMKASVNVAVKIAEDIFASGLAGIEKPGDLKAFLKGKMYIPVFK